MRPEISERSFEEAIECGLLRHGPDGCAGDPAAVEEAPAPYGATTPGGYLKRRAEDYDRALGLLPRDVVDFVLATQPKEWQKLAQHHGAAVREQFLRRLAREIERREALDVLRSGIKDSGCKFQLAYFRPASGLNEETRRLHAANLFAAVRQVRYSEKNESCLDLVLFLNGIPIFTAELKNPLNGQTVQDAIQQYMTNRDPREPLLGYGRCLAHFAVNPNLVYVTAQLAGPKTRFLPFNQGKFGGAGNPPVPPTRTGYPAQYLWQETWARNSVLDLVRQFIQEKEIGELPGKRFAVIVDEAHSSQSGESTCRRSPSPPRPSPRRWSSSARNDPTGSSRPSTSTACGRRSRRAAAGSRRSKSFVELHPHAIAEKVKIRRAFAAQVQGEIGGRAKAMMVTRSRLHAVRYKLAVDKYVKERGYPFRALVAFSGTVQDAGHSYTEAGMNGFPETQTARTFDQPEYRFLVVANKFQTGFDQPLLHTMYVDKKLGGVNAVQTLSRLNRTHPEKEGTMVLDFANEAETIKATFEPYYETTFTRTRFRE